jgi:aminoglycoside 6'-N-acetyltransferase
VVSYVVCDRRSPVGYAHAWQRSDRCGIDMLIAAHAQGRGVGSAAGRALAEELTAAGWVPLTVDPALDNTRAIEAWRAAGFVETGDPANDGGELVQVMTFVP